MKIIEGSVVAAKGFKATGAAIGIKKNKKDLALIYSEVPATAAACFTTNVVKAASVLRNMEILLGGNTMRGIATNSGNANACTGDLGKLGNEKMAEAFAKALGVNPNEILTASTGVIGSPFPTEVVEKGIEITTPLLGNTKEDGILAAQGIMTTDTYMKEIAVEIEVCGKVVRVGGIAKGSGMIHPNMATMLGFITTDVAIAPDVLKHMLKEDVKCTYNMVSVDGDTSTNDTIIVLANGLAGNPIIDDVKGEAYNTFKAALHFINERLAKDLVRDGEGATKFIEISVVGTKSEEEAKTMAKSVVCSSLVKTAMYGEDANWGRVLCAMGYSGVKFNPENVDISFSSENGAIQLMNKGTPIVFDEEKAAKILSAKEIIVDIKLQEGNARAVAWGCDLSYDYVKINGDYRS